MGFYESVMPEFGIDHDAVTVKEMKVTADTIKTISDNLLKGKDGLHGVKFEDIPAAPAHFGGSRAGSQLGVHHDLAHKVVAGTITGVLKDLQHFSDSLNQAVKDATGADELSSEDMERLGRAVPTTYGEQANENSQSEVLPPGTDDGSTDDGSGDDSSGNEGTPPPSGDAPPAAENENGEG